jgi:hypothetical protein
MLHIITPLYRYENLPKVYSSIARYNNITWHISKTSRKPDLNYDFVKSDKRIKLYNVDCDDTDTTSKRNAALEIISDGYFCFLDDDTVFHENMYMKYHECHTNNFKGMLIGTQLNSNDQLRLRASVPAYTKIDTGNVLSHHECLSICRWPSHYQPGINQKDFLFWDSVYNYYDRQCSIWNQPISFYNKLRPNNV